MGSHAERDAARDGAAHVKSKIAYQGKFISVQQDLISYPDGGHGFWDKVIHPGAVVVIPFDKTGHLVLIEQWRRTIGQISLELPAGLIDPGETIEECAQRELQEEIGQKAGKLEYLGAFYSSPGILNEKIHYFIARELAPSKLYGDDTDKIDPPRQTFEAEQIKYHLKEGTFTEVIIAQAMLATPIVVALVHRPASLLWVER
jgi:ADP-ribose pyrophosphatase